MIASNGVVPLLRPFARLMRFRSLILEMIVRDLKLRYRGSIMGFFWTLLNPVLFACVYTFVFGFMLKVGTERYPAFLLSGLVPWTWFASSIGAGSSAIQDGRMYVGKTPFPIEVLIAVPILSNLLNLLLSVPLILAVDVFLGVHLGLSLILLPVIVLLQFAITFGFLSIVATYSVFYRDLQQLISLVVTFLFFLNPIFYSLDRIPAEIQRYAVIDPITPLMNAYHDVLFQGAWPSFAPLAYTAIFAIVLCILGEFVIKRYHDVFGEYL